MAAPKNNQFWKQRSKHGRDSLFDSSELLWEAAAEYFEWCDANPWLRTDFKGKNAKEVYIPTARPYTIQGFCLHCDASREWWTKLKGKKKKDSEDFIPVITRIEEIIYTQKFEGAVVGAFNANIISRDLGLIDKKSLDAKLSIEQITGMEIL